MKTARHVLSSLLALAPLTLAACTEAQGTVRITIWGESIIEQGMGAELFPKDHWSVKFTRFLLVLADVRIADAQGTVAAKLAAPQVFDLTKAGSKTVATFALDAQRWPTVSYQLGPLTSGAIPGELASQADVDTLARAGATLHVEGQATGPKGERKTFRWDFQTATLYQDCKAMQAGKEVDGVLVTTGAPQEVQVTIHGDHFFYDDLQSDDAVPRFAALANADANNDGEITLAELDAVPLYTIPADLGPYGTGALGNVNTLGDYVRTLAFTLGHYRGEGSCDSTRAP